MSPKKQDARTEKGGIAPGTETHLKSMQATNSVPPVDPNRELLGMISRLTPEEMGKALEVMANFSIVINSAEYKKLSAMPGISTDEVDDYLFEKVLGKEKMLENAARRSQFRECAGDEK